METTAPIRHFDPARVRPLPGQPRKRFRRIKELADSISEIGQSSPGLVTLVDDDPDFEAQLIDGERRLRACTMAGVTFRAEVHSNENPADTFARSFAVNFNKQNHDAIEIAHALQRMRDDGRTLEACGRTAGMSTTWVTTHLNLLKLHEDVQEMMIPDEGGGTALRFQIAQLLVPLPHDLQLRHAKKIAADGMSGAEARRYVLKQTAGRKNVKPSGQGRSRSIRTLGSIARATHDRIGVYLDMKPAALTEMICNVDDDTKAELADQMEALADGLAGLAEELRKAI